MGDARSGVLIDQIRPGESVYSYGTTIVHQVHNRMPVILKKEDENTRLNPDNTESEQLIPLLMPFPENDMEVKEVSRGINRCHNEFCVTLCSGKALNPVQTYLLGFSAMCHYTKFVMASLFSLIDHAAIHLEQFLLLRLLRFLGVGEAW